MAATSAPASAGTNAASYIKGQCTWGVASLLSWVPGGLGNAGQWLTNAAKKGLAVTSQPGVGDVVVYHGGTSVATADSPAAQYDSVGHVAVVTAVGANNTFQVLEMNYGGGPGKWDKRVSSMQNVQGFIQPPGSLPGPPLTMPSTGSTSATGCAFGVGPFCILSQAGLQRFYGALLMGAGGLILTVGLGLVVVGALAETKLGRATSKTFGAAGLGTVVGAAAAPARAVGQRRTQKAAAASTAASTAATQSHQAALRRAQLRSARARARRAEEGVRTQKAVTQGRSDSGAIRSYERGEGRSRRQTAVESRRAGTSVAASNRRRLAQRQKYEDVFGEGAA